ncbi:hypothetical protein, partial [Stenotrophomonas maltophilia]|uniref:hypothetical protein n=1 Tax=Stenotrophomonas maltophilia TaxID=40324 RepID=UPI001955F08A
SLAKFLHGGGIVGGGEGVRMRVGQGKGVKKQRLAASICDSNRIRSVFDATQHPAFRAVLTR